MDPHLRQEGRLPSSGFGTGAFTGDLCPAPRAHGRPECPCTGCFLCDLNSKQSMCQSGVFAGQPALNPSMSHGEVQPCLLDTKRKHARSRCTAPRPAQRARSLRSFPSIHHPPMCADRSLNTKERPAVPPLLCGPRHFSPQPMCAPARPGRFLRTGPTRHHLEAVSFVDTVFTVSRGP